MDYTILERLVEEVNIECDKIKNETKSIEKAIANAREEKYNALVNYLKKIEPIFSKLNLSDYDYLIFNKYVLRYYGKEYDYSFGRIGIQEFYGGYYYLSTKKSLEAFCSSMSTYWKEEFLTWLDSIDKSTFSLFDEQLVDIANRVMLREIENSKNNLEKSIEKLNNM